MLRLQQASQGQAPGLGVTAQLGLEVAHGPQAWPAKGVPKPSGVSRGPPCAPACDRRSLPAHSQPRCRCHVPAPDSGGARGGELGELGGGAGARLDLEAAPGSARPGRSRHVTGAARSRSRAARGPSHRPAMGDEEEDEGCAVELQITEGGPGAARDRSEG